MRMERKLIERAMHAERAGLEPMRVVKMTVRKVET
jgi:hypothetical protein